MDPVEKQARGHARTFRRGGEPGTPGGGDGGPAGRAAAAWEIAESALSGLGTTRDEWVGADPAHTAAGGWVLVDRVGRLALGAALLSAAPAYPAEQAETCVNAARRYTWNHLRQPPPEAATAVHVRRTADLVDWIAGSAPVERSRA
ncbi:hypothetical protein BU196_11050 [Streptomyces sp. CBMA370]|nr:hypothetical protein [Streptomyces sp. CBMA370]